MKRHFGYILIAALLLAGCGGGGDEAAQNPAGNTATPNTGGNTAPNVNPPAPPAPPPAPGGTSGSETTGLVAPAGSLAAHARGLSIVRPNDFAVIKVDLASARQAKIVQSTPKEIVQGAASGVPGPFGKRDLETIEKVELAWVAVGPRTTNTSKEVPVSFAVYLRAVSPEAITEFLDANPESSLKTLEYNGKRYTDLEEGSAYYLHEGNEIFFSTEEATIKQAIDAGGKIAESPVLNKLGDGKLDSDVVIAGSLGPFKQPASLALAGSIQQLSAMTKQLGLPLPPLEQTAGQLPAQIDYALINVDLEDAQLVDIDADMNSAQAAENFKTTLEGLVSLGKIMLQFQEAEASDEPAVKEMFATAKKVLGAVEVEVADQHVDVSLAHLPELDKLPEVAAAAASAPPKLDEIANARDIGLGAANHHSATRKYPTNIKDDEGNDLLSWRVAILPFIEERLLFDDIDKRAAWDSERNRDLLDIEMPIYRSAANDDMRMTNWKLLPDAPGGVMIIGTGQGTEVHWAKPDNFVINRINPRGSLGPEPEGGYVIAMRDVRVMRLPYDELLKTLGIEPPQPRTWTDSTGKFKIEAVLVELGDGKVTLKRSDTGEPITLPVAKLSAADQEYLKGFQP